jgi:glycosyltransferase involved in cell wall biosynthesis
MKILIATDAWKPQINGVVRTLANTVGCLLEKGHDVYLLSPDRFWSFPCPTYPEIRLAWGVAPVGGIIRKFGPQAIHIATEGPVGLAVRTWCVLNRYPFTTSFTTRFPEYISMRFPISSALSYGYFKWFHSASSATMVATKSIERELERYGFFDVVRWSRGVDTDLFNPWRPHVDGGESPLFLYVGRVSVEKNLRGFLGANVGGTKMVVGDGPDLESLKEEYPDVIFKGPERGNELADIYAAADVFVFPSKTDTFGIVMLEAMACGVPVAAYPVAGPMDIVTDGRTGCLREDLGEAMRDALLLDRRDCRDYALSMTWENATEQFLQNLSFTAFADDLVRSA